MSFLCEDRRTNDLTFCKTHEQWGSAQQYLSPEESQGKCSYDCNCLLDWNYTYLTLGEGGETRFRKNDSLNVKSPAPGNSPFKCRAISHFGERPTVWNPSSKTKCGLLTRHDIKSQDPFSFYSILKAPFSLQFQKNLKDKLNQCN